MVSVCHVCERWNVVRVRVVSNAGMASTREDVRGPGGGSAPAWPLAVRREEVHHIVVCRGGDMCCVDGARVI